MTRNPQDLGTALAVALGVVLLLVVAAGCGWLIGHAVTWVGQAVP